MMAGQFWPLLLLLLLLPHLEGGYPDKAAVVSAFAALKSDGSVVAWGNNDWIGSTSAPVDVASSLTSGVVSISSTKYAFAAVKSDGSVVA